VTFSNGTACVWRTAALFGRMAPDLLLDLVELPEAIKRVLGQGRLQCYVDLEELAPHVSCTSDLQDAWRHIRRRRHKQRIKARVGIHLEFSPVGRQMLLRIGAVPTRRVLIPHRRWISGFPASSIANESPQVSSLGFPRPWGQHFDRRVVRVQVRRRQHILGQRPGLGLRRLPPPSHYRTTGYCLPATEHCRLSKQRKISELNPHGLLSHCIRFDACQSPGNARFSPARYGFDEEGLALPGSL
jgi:hypothetical protein